MASPTACSGPASPRRSADPGHPSLQIDSLRAHGEPVPPPSAVAATVVTVPAA
jgi:hypothetical protein